MEVRLAAVEDFLAKAEVDFADRFTEIYENDEGGGYRDWKKPHIYMQSVHGFLVKKLREVAELAANETSKAYSRELEKLLKK